MLISLPRTLRRVPLTSWNSVRFATRVKFVPQLSGEVKTRKSAIAKFDCRRLLARGIAASLGSRGSVPLPRSPAACWNIYVVNHNPTIQ